MSDVLFFDPRGTFSALDRDLISRHKEYISAARVESSGVLNRLVVFTFVTGSSRQIYSDGLILIIGLNSLSWLCLSLGIEFKTWQVLPEIDPKVISCSDPWLSYLFGAIYQRQVSKKATPIRVQLQIHGDFFSKQWKSGLKEVVKSRLARISISKADQIRCVSDSLRRELIELDFAPQEKVVVAPVPITLSNRVGTIPSNLPRTIGFVGRIQPERGLEIFCNLAKRIYMADPTIKLLIVGDGGSRKAFEELLEESFPKNQIEFTGQLSSEELEKAWERIGILVSTAPSESYGRTLREALMHGVPVWSTDTRGLRDLIQEYPSGAIRKIVLDNSEAKIIEDLTHLFSQKRDFGYRYQYEITRASIVAEIGSFWARLL